MTSEIDTLFRAATVAWDRWDRSQLMADYLTACAMSRRYSRLLLQRWEANHA